MSNPWRLVSTGLAASELDDLEEEMPRGAAVGEIPAIDEPSFSAGRWLRDEDGVVAVEVDGDVRAYPIRVLDYHEIVNDEVGGRPVAVTFCPLCGSGVAWDRRVDDRTLSFIVSGRLYRNDLVMQDRETDSLWPQILGRALHGELAGTQLDFVPSWRTTWGRFRKAHAGGLALDRPDVYPAVTYEERAQPGYADSDETLFDPTNEDHRLRRKELVFGVARGGDALAIRLDDLEEVGVTVEEVDDEDVILADVRDRRVAWWTGGRDFHVDEDGYLIGPQDQRWDPYEGTGADEQLEPARGLVCFWFAWADIHEGTRLWAENDRA